MSDLNTADAVAGAYGEEIVAEAMDDHADLVAAGGDNALEAIDVSKEVEELHNKKYMKPSEYAAFAAGKFGMNCLWAFVSGWILIFYTDVLLLPAWAISVLSITTRIWDGINDPIMGNLVDRTRSRWGKTRPYFLFMAVPVGLSTILMFINPNFSMSGKIAYAFITYIIWDMVYSLCDMPMWSLPSLMSPNPKEREKYITLATIVGMVSGSIIGLMPNFISFVGKENQEYVFLGMAIFVGLAGTIGLLATFKGTRERVKVPKTKEPIIKNMKAVLKNKLLMLYLAANVGGWVKAVGQGLGFYFTWYVLRVTIGGTMGGDPGIVITTAMTVYGMVVGLPYTIGGAFFPWIMKKTKVNYRTITIWTYVLFAAVQILIYFICGPILFERPSLLLYFAVMLGLNLIPNLLNGLNGNAEQMMLTEAMDYFEWKTGNRAEGASFSLLTFFGKMSNGIVAALTSVILALVNYAPNEDQTLETMKLIFAAYLIIPAIGAAMQAIPYFFYDFVGEKKKKIYEELALQRKQKLQKKEYVELIEDEPADPIKLGWKYKDLL